MGVRTPLQQGKVQLQLQGYKSARTGECRGLRQVFKYAVHCWKCYAISGLSA